VTVRGIRVGRSKGRKLMEDIKRILVMSRSTTDCKKAVHYGISLARTRKAQLYILHVIHEPFGLRNVPFISSLRFLEEEFQAMLQKVKSDLDMLIQKERTRGISIKELVKEAEPVDEIVKIVQEEKIDLLLMAAHDETRIEHIIYGRINHEIVRKLPCSVFLVKG
jgi:nucleotide-binding universal stress UspA family protein